MVAALVLAVGVLGTFTLLDGANRTLQENNGRVGASNLAREIAEQARGLDYDSLVPGTAQTLLIPKIDDGTATAAPTNWKVERRNVTYTIALNVCTFDDPKDGIVTVEADKAPNACPTPAPVNTTVDSNPDDFRRLEMVLSWSRNGSTSSMTQTALIVNPSGGLGPRTTDLYIVPVTTPPTKQITDPAQTQVLLEAKTKLASTLHWSADDGDSGDLSGGSGYLWNFAWGIGDLATGNVDGSYTISAQAFSGRGVPGDVSVLPVLLNRRWPLAVAGLLGGRNNRHGGIVDLLWDKSVDRDVEEYRVYEILNDVKNPTPVCTTRLPECTDLTPPGTASGSLKYEIVAVDRIDLSAPISATNLREGNPNRINIGLTGTRPKAPVLNSLITTDANGIPHLTWTQPTGGDTPIFYRIYREDGTGVGRRYDRTFNATPSYGDPTPGTAASHQYWITAVDAELDESADSNVVTWVKPS